MSDKTGLILVGVVHGDPNGYDRLREIFDRFRPQGISLEISGYSWRCRQRRQSLWQRQFHEGLDSLPPERRDHPALQRVAAQIAMPFEVRAAADYARRHGIAWQAVDIKALAREHLPLFSRELLHPDNLRQLSKGAAPDWADSIGREYRRARRILETGRQDGVPPAGLAPSPLASLREKVLARRVARLAKLWGLIVHVGGWEHLIRSGPSRTMADFLTPLAPQLFLLDELGCVRPIAI